MTEGTLPGTPDAALDDGASGEPQVPSTPEEWAAFHESEMATQRHRQSQSDRAHAAEVASLREQMAALSRGNPQTPPPANESPEAAENRELRAQLERRDRFDALAQKYPNATRELGTEATNLSEERLAKVEAMWGEPPPAPPMTHPNQAPRRAPGQPEVKPVQDKTADELKQDLRALTPAYKQMLDER